jgi:hypothetical protein
MAATLKDIYKNRYDRGQDFFERVTAACAVAAINILWEDTATKNHEARVAWAKGVMGGDTRTVVEGMLWFVCVNDTIAANLAKGGNKDVPDEDIQYVVNGSVDFLAV